MSEHKDFCGCGHDHSHEEHEHHHDHEEGCGCGHDHSHEEHEHHHEHHHEHGESCGCGHDHSHEEHEHHHEHHHEHGDSCGCGHDHSHEEHEHHHEHHHEHGESCGCGHDHGQEVHTGKIAAGKQIYILEHLGCANCASKMERKINELPEVTAATITFATKQLRLDTDSHKDLLPILQEICSSIEPEVKVVPQTSGQEKRMDAVHAERRLKKQEEKKEQKKELALILLGAALLVLGKVLEGAYPAPATLLFVLSYLLLGGEIVLTAAKNLTKGHVFDENFLMSIATIGAFLIGEYAEAVGVMLFYRVGEFFEHVAVEKSRSQIMDAIDMRPEVVNLVNGSDLQTIAAEDAKVGDILLVRPGDRIPLDGVLVDGESRIDTSPVTGEPVPVKVTAGDAVTSGCVNTSGTIKIRVEKVLSESMVTRILNSVENAAASKPSIDRFITRFARIYTPIVVAAAAATAILPSLITGNWSHWVYTALTFLVISCPCALVLSVPLAFFSGIGAGSKKGILFKGGASLEALRGVRAVVMDKTGTITKGNFVVQKVQPAQALSEQELLALAAGCESTSTHPIGNSIVTAAREQKLSIPVPASVEEIAGKGIRAQFPEGEVLCGNKKLMEDFHISMDALQEEPYGSEVFLARDGRFLGHLVIADSIKEEAASAIRQIRKLGIATIMLTGDAQESAEAVAKATEIDEVHARLLPEDKLTELQKIRAAYGSVMFVGDGINDAPVLAGADVGAAMGSGSDTAIEAADVVFMTSRLDAIPEALAIARNTYFISRLNVAIALVIKIAVMLLGLAGFASMWMAVFADTGVAMICILLSIMILFL